MSFIDQAIEQCRKTRTVYEDAMPLSGKALAMGLGWLEEARRLRLELPLIPNGPEEHKVASVKEYGYGVDTPWQVTAIEYEHGGVYDVEQDFTRALSTRRIALCVNIPDSVAPMARDAEGEAIDNSLGSLVIWPISFFDEKNEWEFSPGVVIVPRAQGEREMALAENQYLALAHRAETSIRGWSNRSRLTDEKAMMVRYQDMMPELCVKLGHEHTQKMIKESSMDALWVVLGCFTAMSCKNVFIQKEDRFLTVYGDDKKAAGLDPFRGKRITSWNGKGKWLQETRGISVNPKLM